LTNGNVNVLVTEHWSPPFLQTDEPVSFGCFMNRCFLFAGDSLTFRNESIYGSGACNGSSSSFF